MTVRAVSSSKEKSTVNKPAAKVKSASAKAAPKTAAPTSAAKKPAPDSRAAAKRTAAPAKVSPAKPLKAEAKPEGSKPVAKGKSAALVAPAPKPVPAAAAPPTRSGRVSRLSLLTVPSMPQSVASNAAKSSFSAPGTAYVPPAPAPVKKNPKLANNWKSKSPEQLSDEEVIAMPDSEYMNEKQMAYFRLKLLQLKRGILENAGETTEHLREDTVVVPDPADRATIEEEHALELRTRDRERKLLKKIEQSIQRIDAGDYGYCDETGEPIGVGRLLARPTATLSLEAQQRRELKQKMFGD